jgi:hypothetical protein
MTTRTHTHTHERLHPFYIICCRDAAARYNAGSAREREIEREKDAEQEGVMDIVRVRETVREGVTIAWGEVGRV